MPNVRKKPPTAESELLEALGSIAFGFSQLENNVRVLIRSICANQQSVELLVAQLSTEALSRTLGTSANLYLVTDDSAKVQAVRAEFDNLREYRNYYMHSALSAQKDELGLSEQKISKHKLVSRVEIVKVDALWDLADGIYSLSTHIMYLMGRIAPILATKPRRELAEGPPPFKPLPKFKKGNLLNTD